MFVPFFLWKVGLPKVSSLMQQLTFLRSRLLQNLQNSFLPWLFNTLSKLFWGWLKSWFHKSSLAITPFPPWESVSEYFQGLLILSKKSVLYLVVADQKFCSQNTLGYTTVYTPCKCDYHTWNSRNFSKFQTISLELFKCIRLLAQCSLVRWRGWKCGSYYWRWFCLKAGRQMVGFR